MASALREYSLQSAGDKNRAREVREQTASPGTREAAAIAAPDLTARSEEHARMLSHKECWEISDDGWVRNRVINQREDIPNVPF